MEIISKWKIVMSLALDPTTKTLNEIIHLLFIEKYKNLWHLLSMESSLKHWSSVLIDYTRSLTRQASVKSV